MHFERNGGVRRAGTLAEQARDGDHFAGAKLYRDHVAQVHRYLLTALRNPEDAEDATQQVFLKLFEALPRYEATQPFDAWLFTLVRNVAIDWRRRSGRSAPVDPQALASTAAQEVAGRVTPLRELVAALPPLQREAIVLLYEDDLSAGEAGRRLGRSADATRQLHRRALKRLESVSRVEGGLLAPKDAMDNGLA